MKKAILFNIVVLFFLKVSYGQYNLDSGLMLYYPLNGNAKDYSGNNRNGLINGPIQSSDMNGKSNSCYLFDGVNDFISFPIDSLMSDYFTYSLWVYPTSTPDFEKIGYALAIGGESGGSNIALTNTSLMKGWFGGSYNIGIPMLTLVATGQLPITSKWYHIVLSRDSIQMKLYVNGVLNSNVEYYNGFNDSTKNTKPKWGISPGGTLGTRMASNFFNGKIDDVRIYNRSLSNDEVNELFTSGAKNTSLFNFSSILDQIEIYPIPAQKFININTDLEFNSSKIKVYNILGQNVDFELSILDSQTYNLNILDGEKGIYFIEFEINGELFRKVFQLNW